jgi:hypothetical protein
MRKRKHKGKIFNNRKYARDGYAKNAKRNGDSFMIMGPMMIRATIFIRAVVGLSSNSFKLYSTLDKDLIMSKLDN